MENLKSEMPKRNPDDEQSGIFPGGLPGNQSGGDWESENPDLTVIAQHLVGIDYPIQRDDLVQHIRWQKAPLAVIERLEHLPDRSFNNAQEISQALEQV
jgi:hypothetical protein